RSQTAIQPRPFQECDWPGYSRADLCKPEGLRSDLERRDGAKRLPPRQSAECLLWRTETILRDQSRRVCFQHVRSDYVDTWIARPAPLDFAKTTRSAKELNENPKSEIRNPKCKNAPDCCR